MSDPINNWKMGGEFLLGAKLISINEDQFEEARRFKNEIITEAMLMDEAVQKMMLKFVQIPPVAFRCLYYFRGGSVVLRDEQKRQMRETDYDLYWKWEGDDLRELIQRLEAYHA